MMGMLVGYWSLILLLIVITVTLRWCNTNQSQ